ncbi:hypothetical protein CALCODRAFT_149638 [Calocera cornea HHB12733]|uniref:Uncharacterized protein n=1 Tax=Calocera cornea HHB12733 TaxID=1353952 RepID=A0A165I3M1_9BASI|nr:hypothetical protein CALCODRAFT_149638 [Calocera cornea HHB12733]
MSSSVQLNRKRSGQPPERNASVDSWVYQNNGWDSVTAYAHYFTCPRVILFARHAFAPGLNPIVQNSLNIKTQPWTGTRKNTSRLTDELFLTTMGVLSAPGHLQGGSNVASVLQSPLSGLKAKDEQYTRLLRSYRDSTAPPRVYVRYTVIEIKHEKQNHPSRSESTE